MSKNIFTENWYKHKGWLKQIFTQNIDDDFLPVNGKKEKMAGKFKKKPGSSKDEQEKTLSQL